MEISSINEKEIIEKINCAIHVNEMTKSINGDNTYVNVNDLKGLLDLYQAEKEKNKALKEGLKYRINYCKLLEKELYANEVNYKFEQTEIEKQLLKE